MIEAISAQKFIMLQTMDESGTMIVHIFEGELKSEVEGEYEKLEDEAKAQRDLDNLDFGRTKRRGDGSIWHQVTESIARLSMHRGDLRLVKVTRRGGDFVGFVGPGLTETWLPANKIAAVRVHGGDR